MKRAILHLLSSLCVLAVLIALVVIFRLPLAEAGLLVWLRHQGIGDVDLSVVALDEQKLEIADIRVGDDASLRIEQIVITYSPESLASRRAESVAIVGVHLRAALGADGVHIAGINLPRSDGGSDSSLVLPASAISLQGAEIELTTPSGALHGSASGRVDTATDGSVDGRLTASLDGEVGHALFQLALHGPALDTFEGALTLADGAIATPQVSADALHGVATFSVAGGKPLRTAVTVAASGVAFADVPGGLRGEVSADAKWRPDDAGTRLKFVEAAGGRGLNITANIEDIALDGDAISASVDLDGTVDRLDQAGLTLDAISLNLPATIVLSPKAGTVALRDDARLTARKAAFANAARAAGPLVAIIHPTSDPLATVTREGAGGIAAFDHTVSAALQATAFRLGPPDAVTRTLETGEVRINLKGAYTPPAGYTARGTLATSEARLDEPALGFQRVEADFTVASLDPDGKLRLDIGSLTDSETPERFRPIGVTVKADIDDGRTTFTASLTDAMRTTRLTASGRWPLDGPRDEIFIEIPQIDFLHGGLQPGTLAPKLDAFDVAKGSISGLARIRRAGDELAGRAELYVDDLTFDIAGATVTDLDMHADLDSLLPPTTPLRQKLSIRRIDTVTPVSDIEIVYSLAADAKGQPRLDIASGQAGLLGGTLSVADISLTLADAPADVPIAVSGLDLPELFALIGVDGLDGTGSLSGRVPLRLAVSTIEVQNARLAADGPGELHLRADSAAAFLAAQGESVDLALRALEDFRYSELTVSIDRKAGGDARVALSVLGHNPAVLDGHPFRFNININSNIDELLAALLQGYRIATGKIAR